MSKDEFIKSCNDILIHTQSKKLQRLFHNIPMNQDIVIDKLKRDDMKLFTQRMLTRFEKYIEKE